MSMWPRSLASGAVAFALGLALLAPSGANAAGKIRIAFGDIASVESLHLLAALECAKEKGLDLEVSYLKAEDIAAQAVVSGQADIGVGTPYALIQKVKAPVRLFVQLAPLRFYPIVNTEFYKTWKDLDGQDVAVHARGSGTEAIMKLMAEKHGIKYSNISYVPGAEVRAGALLQGNVKASIVDAANRRMLMEKAPGKFAVLPMEGVSATDEALFANRDFLEREAASIDTLLECVLTTWRSVAATPDTVMQLRSKYKLLPDLPAGLESTVAPYFRELAEAKGLPLNGGGEAAVKDDFAFFTLAGQLQGDAAGLKVEDFWDLRPLNRVVAKIGAK
jgi:NitT/TauT family transport system substrate-binding protein